MRLRCLFGRHRVKLYSTKKRGGTFVGQRCRDCKWKERPENYQWAWDLSPRVQRFWSYVTLRDWRRNKEMYGDEYTKLKAEVYARPFVSWKARGQERARETGVWAF